jgi:hypothetical protein
MYNKNVAPFFFDTLSAHQCSRLQSTCLPSPDLNFVYRWSSDSLATAMCMRNS